MQYKHLTFKITKDSFNVEMPSLNNPTVLKDVINTIFTSFKPAENYTFLDHLNIAWGEYQMWWSKSGDKDFVLAYNAIKKLVDEEKLQKAAEKFYEFLRNQYKIAMNVAQAANDKDTVVYKPIQEKHLDFFKNDKKSINERIRLGYGENYKPGDVAIAMGIKPNRASTIYTKLKKQAGKLLK